MKNSWIIFILLLSLGCAPTIKFKELLATWKGAEVEALVESWGRPLKIYHKTNGNIILEYELVNGTEVRYLHLPRILQDIDQHHQYQIISSQLKSQPCKAIFTADDNNLIIRWQYKADQCKIKKIPS